MKRNNPIDGVIIGKMVTENVTFYTLEDEYYQIPKGTYTLQTVYSDKFKCKVLLLKNVPGHTSIEIHPGNFKADSKGCILIGLSHTDKSVVASRGALRRLLKQLDGQHDVHLVIS